MPQENRWIQVEFYAQLPEGEPLDITGLSSNIKEVLMAGYVGKIIFSEIEGISFSVQTDSPYYGEAVKTGRHHA